MKKLRLVHERKVAKPRKADCEGNVSTGKRRAVLVANAIASPHLSSAQVITYYGRSLLGEISILDMVTALQGHAATINSGNLGEVEAMLSSQAMALNIIFAELARKAALNLGEHIVPAEMLLKLALKAQSQCRATLETLAAIKNPPIFAKQANIAHGPQQVNNDFPLVARVEEIKNPPTELLEQGHEQRMDNGTTAAASGSDQAMAAVEKVDRPAHGRRKKHLKP